jgi:hypothetical protein
MIKKHVYIDINRKGLQELIDKGFAHDDILKYFTNNIDKITDKLDEQVPIAIS